MKDEISAARRKKRRRRRLRRFFSFILVVVLVIAGFTVADTVTKTTFSDIGDFFTVLFKGGSYPVSLGSGLPLQAEPMTMSYAVLTKHELLTYSSSGGRLLQMSHSLSSPCIATANNRVALYSVGSRDVSVYNRTGHLNDLRAGYAIVDVGVANNGAVVLLTQGERWACHLEVYRGGDNDPAMTWNGVSGFPLAAAIRPDGKVAAAARVSASAGGVVTIIAVIDLHSKQELYECTVPDLVTYMFFDGQALIAVTDRDVVRVSGKEKIDASYDFGRVPLLAVAHDNGPVAVALGDNNRPDVNTVTVLDKNLNVQCRIEGVGAVRDMVLSGNRIYVLGDRIISEYNMRGSLLRRYETDTDTLMVLDINGIIAFQPDSANRIQVHIKEEEE